MPQIREHLVRHVDLETSDVAGVVFNNRHVSIKYGPRAKPPSTVERRLSVSGRNRPRVQDRRIARTHRALREALIELALERSWDAVSVADVCARANVGRSTFYVHFADKEELLLTGFGDLRRTLEDRVAEAGGSSLAFARPMLEQARAHEPLFRTFVGKRTAHVIRRAFLDVVIHFLEVEVADVPPGPPRDAAVRYLAGAFWELYRWWCEDARRMTVQEVDEMFRRLTVPVLRALKSAATERALVGGGHPRA